MGTYTSPLAEINVNNLRSKNTILGFYAKSESSFSDIKLEDYQKKNASYSDDIAQGYGKYIMKAITISGDAGVKYNMVNYYGYNTALPDSFKDNTKQCFLLMNGKVKVESNINDSNKLRYVVNAKYDYFTDLYRTKVFFDDYEKGFNINGAFNKKVNKYEFSLSTGLMSYGKSSSFDSVKNTIFVFNPSFSFHDSLFKILLGINTATEINPKKDTFYIYPCVNIQFIRFKEVFIPYIGMDGNLEANTFQKIATENPFIMPLLNVQNTNHQIILFAGLKGSLTRKIEYNIKVSYSAISNQYFFINDPSNRFVFGKDSTNKSNNQFVVVYDNIKIVNYLVELSYFALPKLYFYFKGNYNQFTMDKELEPWEMPTLTMDLQARYNLRNKIIIKGDITYISDRYAKSFTNPLGYNKLSSVTDGNLSVEYRKTKELSFFINLNNIAASTYYQWNQYPTHRFQLVAGLTYSL